ncbi:hypothetical protein [Bradyrhizobium liaoningense]
MMRMLNLSILKNEAVMAGFVPAIHALPRGTENVDARDKPGHDDAERAKT